MPVKIFVMDAIRNKESADAGTLGRSTLSTPKPSANRIFFRSVTATAIPAIRSSLQMASNKVLIRSTGHTPFFFCHYSTVSRPLQPRLPAISFQKQKEEAKASSFLLVRMTGLEPARRRQRNLNPPSLPIPPRPHILLCL